MVFACFSQCCLPALADRDGGRERMSQEQSDQEGHFTDTPTWLGALSDPFPLLTAG